MPLPLQFSQHHAAVEKAKKEAAAKLAAFRAKLAAHAAEVRHTEDAAVATARAHAAAALKAAQADVDKAVANGKAAIKRMLAHEATVKAASEKKVRAAARCGLCVLHRPHPAL